MAETRVETFTDVDLTDALVIVAFPSTGAASPIAGAYLMERLDMPLVGHLVSDAFSGIVNIEDGKATSPIRIHGGEVACELDKPCRGIYIISTEVPLPLEVTVEAAHAILEWAKDARVVLALEAVVRESGDDTPDVYSAFRDDASKACIEPAGVEPIGRAMIAGMTAVLLASDLPAKVASLMVEAAPDHPDGRAAAALITALDPLIPQIKVDAQPLLEDAMRLEQEIQAAMTQAEQAQSPRRTSHSFI